MFWKDPRSPIAYGACHGALAWLAYAQVEYISSATLPLRFAGFTLPRGHWAWTAVIFACYGAMGLLLGALAAAAVVLLKHRGSKIQPSAILSSSALGFVAVYVPWLVVSGAGRGTGLPGVVAGVALGTVLLWNIVTGSQSWTVMLGYPWVAPLLLLGPFKIADFLNVSSLSRSWAVFIAWTLAVSATLFVMSRMRAMFSAAPRPARIALLLASSCILLFGITAAYSSGLPAAPSPQGAAIAAGRPNVLLVIWDTARSDRTSVYGYSRDTTPFLRAYAEHATLYRNAFSASDMTLSSSASLFTGLYASWHGAHFSRVSPYGRPLDARFRTIAESLRDRGYTTMAVLANCSYLSPTYRLNRGFQLYDVRTPVGSDAVDHEYHLRLLLQRILGRFASAGELDRRFRRGDEITDDVLRLANSVKDQGRPFFLVANYMDAHQPYIPPAPYNSLFAGKDPTLNFKELGILRREVLQSRRAPTAREFAHITSQYDGSLAFLDSEFRRLIDGLKKKGLYDSTLIVLTADHGEALGDRGMMEHAVSVYQDQVHVPLLVKYPGESNGAVITTPVSGIDIMPTILEAAGAEPMKKAQGRSLLQPDPSRSILSESFRSGLLVRWSPKFDRVERSIVRGNWKWVESTAGKAELYDLGADPLEAKNLFPGGEAAGSELHQALAAMIATAPGDSAPAQRMDKQTMERLRSLGYVQ